MKMKDEKQKHNHKITELIKICIFGLLMIAPLFASVSQMLYVTFNKNAKDSYYSETINQSEYVNVDNLQLNKNYYFNNSNPTSSLLTITGIRITIENLSNYVGPYQTTIESNINNIKYLYFSNSGTSNAYIGFQDVTYTTIQNVSFANSINFNFDFLGTNTNTIDTFLLDRLYTLEYNKYSFLDNAFYYGVDQMTQSDLFNWTQNTAIYTGVKAMTDNLQIQTPAIAILIVYWFILTIIYVIIDIVLKCFTTITHMIFRAD